MASLVVGVDFGGTTLKGGVVAGARIERRAEVPTPSGKGAAAVLDAVAELARELAPDLGALGVAIPGEVDAAGRCWRLPNVPGFEGVAIAEELQRRLGCPVAVENDATAAAHAELRHGHGDELDSFLLVTLGTGIGGGLVLDGRVRRGANGFAGEIGHVRIDSSEEAWPCGCGLRGCMEARAGTKGVLRAFEEAGGRVADDARGQVRPVAEAARAGDEAALSAFASMGRALGLGLAAIQNVLDLDGIVFTGGVARSMELIEPALREQLRERAFSEPLAEVPLLTSELEGRAGIVGAAGLATA